VRKRRGVRNFNNFAKEGHKWTQDGDLQGGKIQNLGSQSLVRSQRVMGPVKNMVCCRACWNLVFCYCRCYLGPRDKAIWSEIAKTSEHADEPVIF